MKIKPSIYLAAALLGVLCLFLGPGLLGRETGLALGFALLMFGLYGISRGSGQQASHENKDPDD